MEAQLSFEAIHSDTKAAQAHNGYSLLGCSTTEFVAESRSVKGPKSELPSNCGVIGTGNRL